MPLSIVCASQRRTEAVSVTAFNRNTLFFVKFFKKKQKEILLWYTWNQDKYWFGGLFYMDNINVIDILVWKDFGEKGGRGSNLNQTKKRLEIFLFAKKFKSIQWAQLDTHIIWDLSVSVEFDICAPKWWSRVQNSLIVLSRVE